MQLLYRVIALGAFGIDIPVATWIGPGLAVHHGMALVINGGTRIGARVTLRHSTTLGSRRTDLDCPVLDSGVDVGPNSVLLGSISIGAGARIGAGSVVLHDVPRPLPSPATLPGSSRPKGRPRADLYLRAPCG